MVEYSYYLICPIFIWFCFPGLKTYLVMHGACHPSREEFVGLLKKGHVVSIAPGGLREQNYGDKTYKLIWGNRQGFAHIAIQAKVVRKDDVWLLFSVPHAFIYVVQFTHSSEVWFTVFVELAKPK